jgi:lysozyme family protein
MTRFDACLAVVLRFEGGYSDRAADRGGPTACGITWRTYDAWRTRHALPTRPVRLITPEEVRAIYDEDYWRPVRGADLAEPLDLVMFDGAVNAGVVQAGRWLQRAVGVHVDGVIGPVTLAAVQARDAAELAGLVLDQRAAFYRGLAERDPTQGENLRGWLRRVDELRAACAASAP